MEHVRYAKPLDGQMFTNLGYMSSHNCGTISGNTPQRKIAKTLNILMVLCSVGVGICREWRNRVKAEGVIFRLSDGNALKSRFPTGRHCMGSQIQFAVHIQVKTVSRNKKKEATCFKAIEQHHHLPKLVSKWSEASGRLCLFQQDNAKQHAASFTTKWLCRCWIGLPLDQNIQQLKTFGAS